MKTKKKPVPLVKVTPSGKYSVIVHEAIVFDLVALMNTIMRQRHRDWPQGIRCKEELITEVMHHTIRGMVLSQFKRIITSEWLKPEKRIIIRREEAAALTWAITESSVPQIIELKAALLQRL